MRVQSSDSPVTFNMSQRLGFMAAWVTFNLSQFDMISCYVVLRSDYLRCELLRSANNM